MRRLAKAPSAGSGSNQSGRRVDVPVDRRRAIGAAFLTGFVALLSVLVFAAGPASAVHIFESQLGSEGSGDGQLSSPRAIGVDQSSGDVYVANAGNTRIEKFDASGSFVLAFGADVGGPGVDTCISGCLPGTSGAGAGEFTTPAFVAVDNSSGPSAGDVYVADAGTNLVQKFDSSGSLITGWGVGGQLDGSTAVGGSAADVPFGEIAGIAVDASGTLFVLGTSSEMFTFAEDSSFISDFNTEFSTASSGVALDSAGNIYKVQGSGAVAKLDPAGSPLAEEFDGCGCATGLAIDGSNDHLYVDRGRAIVERDVDGTLLDEFGSSNLYSGTGLAVRGSSGKVYAADPSTNSVHVFALPSSQAPTVVASGPGNVGFITADLRATINPGYALTTYRFEYGPTTAYGSVTADTAISGGADQQVSAHLTGLSPGTTYHFRVVATNSAGQIEGPDRTLTTFATNYPSGLPDGRAYELVSAAAKNGGTIGTSNFQNRVSDDGNRAMYVSTTAFGDALGVVGAAQYIAERGVDGWTTHSIAPPQHTPATPVPFPSLFTTFQGEFSPDLSTGIFNSSTPLTPVPNVETIPNLYLRQDLDKAGLGTYSLLSKCPDCTSPLTWNEFDVPTRLAGASADFSQVIFESTLNLTANASGELPKLYEWDNGTVTLAGILPDNTPAEGSYAGLGAGYIYYTPNMISQDGRHVFFTASPFEKDINGKPMQGDIYMREDATTTVRLNESERSIADPSGHKGAKLWAATPDGQKAFFTSDEQLTDDDETSTGAYTDLYMADLEAPANERLTLLSKGAAGAGGVTDVLGASEDGRYVYFLSQSSLTVGQEGVSEQQNGLYVWHSGTISFVGKLGDTSAHELLSGAQLAPAGSDGGKDVRVSPQGDLIFASDGKITSYDPVSPTVGCADSDPGDPCSEIYLYRPSVGHVVCASCNPTGAPPRGSATFTTIQDISGGYGPNQYLSNAVTDDGTKVFYSSPDALVPQDTNGRYDAYEYNAVSGEIRLLSTGQCNCDSYFVNANPSGTDAFFTTAQQLVRIDTDNLRDLYDARVGGGIAAQNAVPPSECQGDSCQGAINPPDDPTPGSASFRGAGSPKQSFKKRPAKRRHRHKARRGHHRHSKHGAKQTKHANHRQTSRAHA